MTITLPPHRAQQLHDLLHNLSHQKRTSTKKWHHLLGVLCSTTPALYGAKHLFSILQHALRQTQHGRLHITHLLRQVHHTWLLLIETMSSVPVPLHMLVPHPPQCIAATDASGQGMGGFWRNHASNVLWRSPFPNVIKTKLLTASNPTGTITINDLELAAIITGGTLAAQDTNILYSNILLASDNIPAISWVTKGSTTCDTAPAFLVQHLSTIRCAHLFDILACYTLGDTNKIADCRSRFFHLSDTEFLAYMNHTYLVQPCWQLLTLPNEIKSVMTFALLRQPPPPALLCPDPM